MVGRAKSPTTRAWMVVAKKVESFICSAKLQMLNKKAKFFPRKISTNYYFGKLLWQVVNLSV